MILSDLFAEIRDLGFEDDTIFQEYDSIIRTSITRACKLIATLIKAPTGSLVFDFKDLGTTTTAIAVGDSTAVLNINGKAVTVESGNIATYGGDTLTYIGGKWQELGRYNLDELTTDINGNIMYDDIDRIVETTQNGERTFLRYDISPDDILVISPSYRGSLTVYYFQRILPITSDTPGTTTVQVVYPCDPLVALLTAHYVWLDDDERKAIIYWNEFDQLRAEIEAKAFKLKGRVVGGF